MPALVETTVPVVPTFLRSGRRYAIVLVTTGDHYVAMTNTDNGIVQGTFFVSTDGAFFAGTLLTGSTLAGTETADVVEDQTQSDGTLRRSCVFNMTSQTQYAVRIAGATTTAAETFHVAEMVEYANT